MRTPCCLACSGWFAAFSPTGEPGWSSLLAEEMHKSYVPREDCRERTAQILGGLERADEKLDRIADAIRTGGR